MSIDLLKGVTSSPILTLIYLSHYPEGKTWLKKLFYIVLWIALFGVIEVIAKLLGMISNHHGWSLWWSLMFDFIMFTILAIHYKRPILALVLSGLFIVFLWELFDITFDLLK